MRSVYPNNQLAADRGLWTSRSQKLAQLLCFPEGISAKENKIGNQLRNE